MRSSTPGYVGSKWVWPAIKKGVALTVDPIRNLPEILCSESLLVGIEGAVVSASQVKITPMQGVYT